MSDSQMPTAAEITASIKNGDTTAAAVVEQHLDLIARNDGEINAFNTVAEEAARSDAAEVDSAIAEG